MGGTDGRSTRAQVAMGRRVIQMPLSIHSSVILHTKYTKRRLNDSTAHGYAQAAAWFLRRRLREQQARQVRKRPSWANFSLL